MDLFDYMRKNTIEQPLASRLRLSTLDEVCGGTEAYHRKGDAFVLGDQQISSDR